MLFDGALGGRRVNGDFAAEEIARVEPSQYEVGIGDRGVRPASAIAGRPGIGPGTLRADPQDAAGVHPSDGPAARADFHEVDHGGADGIARAARRPNARLRGRSDLVVLGYARRAVLDQRGFGRRPAHIERNHVLIPPRLPQMRGRNHAGGRAGLNHVNRLLPRRSKGIHPAATLHYEQLGGDTGLGQPIFDPLQIACDHRTDATVDRGRAGPQILAELGCHFGRQRDDGLGKDFGENRPGPPLVDGVGVGVQKADGDGLYALRSQRGRYLAQDVFVERCQHGAAGIEALGYAKTAVARHERPGLFKLQVVESGTNLAGDLQHIAEALGGDKARWRDLALDDGVGGDCGAVNDVSHVFSGDLLLGEQPLHSFHKPARRVLGGRRDFAGVDAPRRFVNERNIGKGAADIDAESIGHRRPSPAVAPRSRPDRLARWCCR